MFIFIENVDNTFKNILILTFSYWAMKISIKNYPILTWPFSGCLVQQWGKEEGGGGGQGANDRQWWSPTSFPGCFFS